MKKFFSVFFFLYSLILPQSGFFVKFKESTSINQINFLIDKFSTNIKESINFIDYKSTESIKPLNNYYYEKDFTIGKIFFVNYNNEEINNLAENYFKNLGEVEYTEANHLYKIDYVPNDQYLSKQWGLRVTRAFEAWDISKGTKDILIAIIDTGIDYLHQDLKANIYVNSAEDLNKNDILDPGDINGIDDDGNGFTDDVIGWDFTDRIGFPFSTGGDYLGWDNDPIDEYGHGTWVAGVIGAVSDNNLGVSGFVPNARFLNIRAFDPTGNGEEDDVAAAILYAIKMGAKVINMSFGDTNFSRVLQDVIKFAYENNVVLVASAGNSASSMPHYPSGYSEVISVGATDERDYLASFSNTGSTIDLVAPGVNLYTTDRNNKYRDFSGTSASAPVVSSAAALLLSLDNFTPEEVKQILKSTAVDLGATGWDERFGAGRVDFLSALSVKAPAVIKINNPRQDFATESDTLIINASILSGFFDKFDLEFGIGFNPTSWINLIKNGNYQFVNRDIYKLNLSNLSDSVYSLKLKVYFKNGLTTEERVNFYVLRKGANAELLAFAPAYYGDSPTILGSIYTDKLSVAFMHYRKVGETDFKVISLDGFSTNNLFFKQIHYGFIPLTEALPNQNYECFFEVKNLAGKSTYLMDKGQYFKITTYDYILNKPKTEQNYSLPYGRISDKSYSISAIPNKFIFQNGYDNTSTLRLYRFYDNNFIKIDSIFNRQVPKSIGDFNNNGKLDLLSYFYPKAIIDEQSAVNSTKFIPKFVDSTGIFRPIMIEDINNDNVYELLALTNDTTISVYKINQNLNPELYYKVYNFSTISSSNYYKNSFGSPSAVISYGVSGKAEKELWLIDSEGDIVCYFIKQDGTMQNGIYITTGLLGLKNILTAGDYDGDGQNDIAVLLESSDDINFAPFKLLLIFNIKNNNLNIIEEMFFIDPSIQFSSLGIKPKSNIKIAKLLGQNNEQLIVNSYPYTYFFNYEQSKTKVILFNKNNDIGANETYFNTFVDDLNSNGIKEFVLPIDGRIKFYEFNSTNQPAVPIVQKCYSLDSNKVYLSWIKTSNKTLIYKGLNKNSLFLLDSTYANYFIDSNLTNNTLYYYRLQAVEESANRNFSELTDLIEVFVHKKIKPLKVTLIKGNGIILEFDGRISTSIFNLESFKLSNGVNPSSISLSSEKSYLINFNPELPKGNYTLIGKGLIDYYGSSIDDFNIEFTVDYLSQTDNFYIQDYSVLDSKSIKINFNLPIDKSSFSNYENYLVNPNNTVIGLDFEGLNSVVVKFKNPIKSTGITYTIKLENVKSSKETGYIKINDGAGSYLAIALNSDNLADIYVYPNPFSFTNSDGVIYFANLPSKVNIIIFDLQGNKIAEINERDGNGGTTWNLKNINGETVGSGIYLYRAAALNDVNQEIEVKLGKFAITK